MTGRAAGVLDIDVDAVCADRGVRGNIDERGDCDRRAAEWDWVCGCERTLRAGERSCVTGGIGGAGVIGRQRNFGCLLGSWVGGGKRLRDGELKAARYGE